MRHKKSGRRLNRTSAHRKAMFGNMANSLFRHEQIKTTLPKAKELRRVAEPLITLAKKPSLHNRRLAFARLRDREIVGKLFDELGPHFQQRPGGYLRILKCDNRAGDNAPMAYVQLVGRSPQAVAAKTQTKEEPVTESEAQSASQQAEPQQAAPKKSAEKKTAKKKTAGKKAAAKVAKKKKTKTQTAAGKAKKKTKKKTAK